MADVFPDSQTDLEPRYEQSIAAVAAQDPDPNRDTWAVIYDILTDAANPAHHGILIRPLYNYDEGVGAGMGKGFQGEPSHSLDALFESLTYGAEEGDGDLILPVGKCIAVHIV